jgi:hypothetical protein
VAKSAFIQAENDLEFIEQLSLAMLRLQKLVSERRHGSAVLDTFRKGLEFTDLLRGHPDLQKFAFEKYEFRYLVMSLFYDESTVLLAGAQISQILVSLQARSPIMQFIFNFISTRLFTCSTIPTRTLNVLIETIATGFKDNATEIGTVFSEAQFLESLINFCVDTQATASAEALVSLLSSCLTKEASYRLDANLFLALEPLVNGSVVDCLLGMAFKDDACMSQPRAIRNAAPLLPLFHIFRNSDDQLTRFIGFVSKCVEADKSSQYELLSSDFASQLVQYMSGFRNSAPTPIFQTVLMFFVGLSQYSLKSKDLVSYFQLFSTLPGNFHPRFTEDLLDGLALIMDPRSISPTPHTGIPGRPTAFFALNGKGDARIDLPPIPGDVVADGFCLIVVAELLTFPDSRGFLFRIADSISLVFKSNESIFLDAERVPYRFRLKTWTEVCLSYDRQSLSLFMDGKLVLSGMERDFGKDGFEIRSLGSRLRCNIASIELYCRPVECRSAKHSFFRCDASTVYQSFAISQDMVATVSGKPFYLSQAPTTGLTYIGGVSALMPLFAQLAQLAQPTPDGTGDSSRLLLRTLRVLLSVLALSEKHQRDFCALEGFAMMAVLLKLAAAGAPFSIETIAGFTQLYAAITHLPLALQMIEHILFNIPLWISHSFDFQELFFKEFFAQVSKTIQNHPNHPGLSESICVTRILYLIRCDLCEADGAQQRLRAVFWGLAVFISDK